jgi:hypothetical protein
LTREDFENIDEPITTDIDEVKLNRYLAVASSSTKTQGQNEAMTPSLTAIINKTKTMAEFLADSDDLQGVQLVKPPNYLQRADLMPKICSW